MFCRKCGKEVPNNEEFCQACVQTQVQSNTITCPYCGKETSETERFCQHCEGFLKDVQSVTKPKTTAKPKTHTNEQNIKICKACGAKIAKHAVYCPNCHKLADVQAPSTTYANESSSIGGFLLGLFLGASGLLVALCMNDSSTQQSAVKGFFVSLAVSIVLAVLLVSCDTCALLPSA